jgi:large subunit ribosomal protein L3
MAEETTKTEEKASESRGAAPAGFRNILGRKLGMTQIFDGAGNIVPVTAIEAGPCPVVQVRTKERDGYAAAQIGFDAVDEDRLSKPEAGHLKKAGQAPLRHLREFRLEGKSGDGLAAGQLVTVGDRFKAGDYVDVRGVSKGKGFAGVMKRHNFRGMPASHGASDKERSPGSLASRRALGRVLPGQRMAGHMGAEAVTVAKLEIIQIVPEENLVYVRGAVPGPAGILLSICETSKPQKRRPERPAAAPKKSKDPLKAAKAAAKGGAKAKK